MCNALADDNQYSACQNDSDGVLTCVPNSLRRREAGNPGKFGYHPYEQLYLISLDIFQSMLATERTITASATAALGMLAVVSAKAVS